MDRQTPRYKKDCSPEDLPKQAEKPTLRVCQLNDSKLVLPRDVRQMFLQDPVWAPEWREMLVKFDEQWGAATSGGAAAEAAAPEAKGGGDVKSEGTGEVKSEAFDWDSVFAGEPTSVDKIKEKHGAGNVIEIVGVSGTSFLVAPGPCLYIVAKEATILKKLDVPVIMHGAGMWLLGEKARKFKANSPGKGIPCSWSDDCGLVCLEDFVSDLFPPNFVSELFFHRISTKT